MAKTIQAIYEKGVLKPNQKLTLQDGSSVAVIVLEPQKEVSIAGYSYLVSRENSWRKQPYIKSRTTTVGQLIYSMRADHLDAEKASVRYSLPIEAIKEAQKYYQQNRDLIESEMDHEKHFLLEKGYRLEP